MSRELGAARAQVHENYIVAQTRDSLVIVDQHAAHERLVYEALKEALHARPMPAQMLLLPEIVDLPEEDAERLSLHADTLARFGLRLERFGPGAVAVRETPAMLGEIDVGQLVRDLADEIADHDTVDTLKERLHHIAATMACLHRAQSRSSRLPRCSWPSHSHQWCSTGAVSCGFCVRRTSRHPPHARPPAGGAGCGGGVPASKIRCRQSSNGSSP